MKFSGRLESCCVAPKRSYKIAGTLANLLASSFRSPSFANPSDCMSTMITADILDLAYQWLCQQRKDAHHNHDVWDLRWHWNEVRPELLQQLAEGTYRLSPTRMVRIEGDCFEVWSSRDSLVLKAVSIVLSRQWHTVLSQRCFHLAGRGGAKAALRQVMDRVYRAGGMSKPSPESQPPKFIFKSDVKSYYASMNHDILVKQLRDLIADPFLLDLVCQYMRRTVVKDGIYRDVQQGIPLGCSLSPLMGAVYLKPLDEAMEKTGLFYARFMDDWVVLAPTRWKLRKVARIINQVLNQLKVWQHPDKTFVGRVAKGFDFLGYHLKPNGLSVANKTRQRFVSRVTRLDEQGSISEVIEGYVRRWRCWARSGLKQWATLLTLDDDVDDCPRIQLCLVSPLR